MSMSYELMMKKKGMPSRYQEVEYIESTGTQYIDTGVYLTGNSRVKIKGQKLNTSRGNRLFGVDKVNEYFRFGSSGQDKYLPGYYNVRGAIDISFTSDIFELDFNKNIITLNNVEIFNTTYNNFTCSLSALLFSVNSSTITDNFIGRIYYCKLYDNNRLVRNFIPVYDTETQKYGMWESVQGKFYGNDGTGDFKGSIVGYTVVGSPTITDGVVSGFSTSDYIRTPNFPLQPTNFEIATRIKNTITTTGNRYFIAGQARTSFIIGIDRRESNTFSFLLYGGSADGTSANWSKASSRITIDETKFFDVKFTYNGTEYALYVNGVKIISHTSTTALYGNAPIYYGLWNIGGSGGVFVGEIDLNNTYIKINNKLWFNGQQA